jgi:hypothetical protein
VLTGLFAGGCGVHVACASSIRLSPDATSEESASKSVIRRRKQRSIPLVGEGR